MGKESKRAFHNRAFGGRTRDPNGPRFAFGGALLMLAALIWGTAFVAQSVGMDYIGPCTFNAVRSFIGSLVLLPVILFASRLRRGAGTGEGEARPAGTFWDRNKVLVLGGALCGVLLGAGSLLQQAGIQSTSAGKAGFLTALYIVIVPILGVFLGRRPGLKVWLGVLVALAGTYCLSVNGDFSIAPGDTLIIVSALFFSLHIMVVDKVSPCVDGIKLSCIQFFVAGVISAVLAFLLETPLLGEILSAWGPLLYTGVMSSGVAYTLQILGQRNVRPTVASLILSLESVFAAVAGWIVLQQPLTPKEIAGCVLVFAAVVLAQLPGRKKEVAENA